MTAGLRVCLVLMMPTKGNTKEENGFRENVIQH